MGTNVVSVAVGGREVEVSYGDRGTIEGVLDVKDGRILSMRISLIGSGITVGPSDPMGIARMVGGPMVVVEEFDLLLPYYLFKSAKDVIPIEVFAKE